MRPFAAVAVIGIGVAVRFSGALWRGRKMCASGPGGLRGGVSHRCGGLNAFEGSCSDCQKFL